MCFIFLDGAAEVIAARMAGRSGHFMPGTLLESQLKTLERPGPDESDVLRLSIEAPIDSVIRCAVQALTDGAAR